VAGHSLVKRLSNLPSAGGGISRLACARAKEAGLDWKELVSAAGLTIKQIEDRHMRLGVRNQIALLKLVADALQDDFLGFHLARDFDLRETGLLYYVMASSGTLGDALQRVVRYSTVSNEAIRLHCPDRSPTVVIIDYVGVPRHLDRHQIEFVLTLLVRICRSLTDLQLSPVRAVVAHRRAVDASEFERFLGCPIIFGGRADQLAFEQSVQWMPVVSADPYLNDMLTRYCEEALSRTRRTGQATLRATVENAIAPLLPHGTARLGEVASKLGISERTLARRLAADGLSFGEILDRLRAELATTYLKEGLPISEIAWLLGYRETSGFTHAFKRWSGGSSPRTARAGWSGCDARAGVWGPKEGWDPRFAADHIPEGIAPAGSTLDPRASPCSVGLASREGLTPRQPAPPEQGGFRESGDVVGVPATKRDLLITRTSALSSVHD
jgi:AraC-like DNA-binding protein